MTSTPVPADKRMSTLVVALAVPLLALIALVITRAVEGPSTATAASSGKGIVIRNFAFTPRTASHPAPATAMIIGITATQGSAEKSAKSDHSVKPWSWSLWPRG